MKVFRVSTLLAIIACMTGLSQSTAAKTFSLDGPWQFATDSAGVFSVRDVGQKAVWRTAIVPLSWQAQFADLRDYQGVAWYRKSFTLQPLASSETALLHFEAVDYIADVFVNGEHVGRHEGGYTPFEFDIRNLVKAGDNEILVRVMDPVVSGNGTEGVKYQNIPHGKQSWYVQTSGLWRSVSLSIKPIRHILRTHITPSLNGRVVVHVALQPWENGRVHDTIVLRIADPRGKKVFEVSRPAQKRDTLIRIEATVRDPELWSLTSPNLYGAEIRLGSNDTLKTRFGFRTIETRDGRLLLNGEPFYLIGALDQDFYPESVYTTPSEEYLRDEMTKAKAIGLNTLRCHIKVPDERYLNVADELGLLVWYEIPNWDVFTVETGERADRTLDAMLERDWNHPSLVIISLINESWGLDLQKPEQRAWLKNAFNRAKEKAAGRLVVDNSACGGNFHVKTDIADYHTYWTIPENRAHFDEAVADLARRPAWLFSTFGDAEETRKEPLLLSEFGNWGLPKVPHPYPWWVNRPFGNATVAFPKDFDNRFREFGYDDIFKTYDHLAEESQRAQFDALKYEIEQLRLSPEIQGYVITEFTDINWESNGLMDMWRNVKIYEKELKPLQQQDVIISRPTTYNFRPGELVEVRTWLSHFGPAAIDGGFLEWRTSTGLHDMLPLGPVARTEVRELGLIRFTLEEARSPEQVRIYLKVKSSNGGLVAESFCDVYVFPINRATSSTALALYDPRKAMSGLKDVLKRVNAPGDLPETDSTVLVTNILDGATLHRLDLGGSLVCLVDSNTQLPQGSPLTFISKVSSWYDGNWATNFNWIRTNRLPFQSVYIAKHLGFEAAGVAPARVITGIPAEHFSDVLAGMFVGWLHLNSGYVLQARVGKGKLILCTLNLADAVGRDPYATLLFNELAAYSRSAACTPGLTLALSR